MESILEQLAQLRVEEQVDDYGILRPTESAFEEAVSLVREAASLAARKWHRTLPHGCVSTDSEGGVRIEWFSPNRAVHLVIPCEPLRETRYIYHEIGNQFDVEYNVTGETLAYWVNWLQQ